MNSVKRIEHTIVSDSLLADIAEGIDGCQSVQCYINALFDAMEKAYPGAKVIIVEVRPGFECASAENSTTVEVDGDESADVIINEIQALASDLRFANNWYIHQAHAA